MCDENWKGEWLNKWSALKKRMQLKLWSPPTKLKHEQKPNSYNRIISMEWSIKYLFFANLNYIEGNVHKKHFEWNFNQFNAKAGITTYAPSNHVILVSLDINYSYVSPCPCRWSCDCARAPSMNNSPMWES